MKHRIFAAGLSGVALIVLMAGCAGPGVLARSSDLSGTWHGILGEVGANQYEDEAVITLRIEDDGRSLSFSDKRSASVARTGRIHIRDLQEHIDRGRDALGRARDVKTHRPMLGKPVTLTAQLLQFLGPKRFLQQLQLADFSRATEDFLQRFYLIIA